MGLRKQSKTTQVFVGEERAAEIARRATSVAYHTNRQCRTTYFIRELIDRYAARLEAELMTEASNPQQADQAGQAAESEHEPGD